MSFIATSHLGHRQSIVNRIDMLRIFTNPQAQRNASVLFLLIISLTSFFIAFSFG